MKIAVKNIYHLLNYAWLHVLETNPGSAIGYESFCGIENLIGYVLCREVKRLALKGLHKGYRTTVDTAPALRGKPLFAESMRHRYRSALLWTCEHSELTEDVVCNQVLKTTLMAIAASRRTHRSIKKQAVYICTKYLSKISILSTSRPQRRQFSTTGINRRYRRSMRWAQRYWLDLLPSPVENGPATSNQERSAQGFGRLFEDFLAGFFSYHNARRRARGLPACDRVVAQQVMDLPLCGLDKQSQICLPKIRADVVLHGPTCDVVIEAKFVSSITQTYWKKETLRADHLRQLLAYMDYLERVVKPSKPTIGVLLYAGRARSSKLSFRNGTRSVRVQVLDLQAEWKQIRRVLIDVLSLTY